jgi:hypothetical protein
MRLTSEREMPAYELVAAIAASTLRVGMPWPQASMITA